MVHDERVDGTKEYTDEGHRESSSDEGGNKPDDELQPVNDVVLMSI